MGWGGVVSLSPKLPFDPTHFKDLHLGSNNPLIDICWPPLAPHLLRPTLPGPSQDLPKNVQSTKWNHWKLSESYLKYQPLTTFCKSRTSKTLIFSFGDAPGAIWAWNLLSLAPPGAAKATS